MAVIAAAAWVAWAHQQVAQRAWAGWVNHLQTCLLIRPQTLAATSVLLTDAPAALSKRLPRYPVIPATLLGRLAVDHRHRGRRLGERMLLDALARSLRNEIATFAVVVDAKDETAATFYKAYDFRPLTTSDRRLFLPMAEIARLFA